MGAGVGGGYAGNPQWRLVRSLRDDEKFSLGLTLGGPWVDGGDTQETDGSWGQMCVTAHGCMEPQEGVRSPGL